MPKEMKMRWNYALYFDIRNGLLRSVMGGEKLAQGGSPVPQQNQSERLDLLVQFDVVDLLLSLSPREFVVWLWRIWKVN